MTTETDKVDQQWLNALAGKSDPAANVNVNQQAESLRRVLKARSERLANQVPVADEAQYQQLQFRLRRENLTSSNRSWRNPMLWGIAATIVMGVGVVIQMGSLGTDGNENDVLRGSEHATVLIVTDPEARLVELRAGLQIAGQEPKIQRLKNGQIVVTIRATEKVLDYLHTQRLEPEVAHGDLTLMLTPTNSNKK